MKLKNQIQDIKKELRLQDKIYVAAQICIGLFIAFITGCVFYFLNKLI